MIFFDELLRRLPSLLHCLMTLLSIPYVLLAIFFGTMGGVSSKLGVWESLDTFLTSFN